MRDISFWATIINHYLAEGPRFLGRSLFFLPVFAQQSLLDTPILSTVAVVEIVAMLVSYHILFPKFSCRFGPCELTRLL